VGRFFTFEGRTACAGSAIIKPWPGEVCFGARWAELI
jgi:hypothetical protein